MLSETRPNQNLSLSPVTAAHHLMPRAILLQSALWLGFTDTALPLLLPKHGYKELRRYEESPNTVN